MFQNWIDSDFDDDLNLDFKFAKPLPPRKSSVKKSANATVVKTPGKFSITEKPLSNSNQPWAEKYTPKDTTQLAVNPKKVSEVKTWLSFNLRSKKPGILMLLGPPGSGKTATIKILAKECQFSIQEWINPNENVEYSSDKNFEMPYISQAKSFRNFMTRANKYQSLGNAGTNKIILLEDLPSFSNNNSEEFHTILKLPRLFPLVIIQSEETLSNSKKSDLFNQDFLDENAVHTINFNAMTLTSLTKVITSIAQGQKCPVPDKNAINSLVASTNGDIRAAINAFQIGAATKMFKRGVFEGSTSLQSSKKKTGKKSSGKSDSNLAVIGGKDVNIDLFHAIGKVLYCKRSEETESQNFHVSKHRLRQKLIIDPEELIENVPMSLDSFTAFLHQSCTDFYTDIKSLSGAIENLSIADPFFNEWTVSFYLEIQ